jgi:PAS domain S-box-containing protein
VALGRLPVACAVFALLVGVSGVVGWMLRSPTGHALVPALTTMKVNTALCLVFAGLALLLQVRERPRGLALAVARLAAVLVVAIAAITLLEYATGRSWIDTLVVTDAYELLSVPGRMSPLTAIGLGSLSVALLALDAPQLSWMRSVLLLMAATLALLALIGFALGARSLYGIGGFTRVTPQTSLALLALAAGQLAARPDRGLVAVLATDSFAGHMARRLLPASLLVPTLVGWLTLHVYRRGLASTEAVVAVEVLATIVMLVPVVAWNARSLLALDTERGRIDRELRTSEAMFRAVTEGAREAIISANALGRITYLNPGAATMFGYATDEALGRPLALLMPRDFSPGGRAGSQGGVVNTGSRQAMGRISESTGLRSDGAEFPLELSLTTWGGDGDARFTAIIRDVSERRRAERERHRLASIVESSADAIYSTALDGTITTWNRAAERIFGYRAAEIVGEPANLLVPEALAREGSGIHARVAHGERVDLPETTRVTRDGRVLPVWLSVSPLEDAAGTVVGASAIVRDLTERNEARKERDRFFTVTHDLLCVADADGRLRRVNPAFLRTLGHGEAEVLGKAFASFVHAEDAERSAVALASLHQGAPTTSFTCRFRDQAGGHRWLAWVVTADPEHGLYAAARDVTEALAGEQRLRDALAEKEVLLKEIHHRVKNNLQIISSLLSFQSRHVTDPTALAAFRESQDRVRSMALFHEKLYQAKDLAHVELADYLRQMAQMLRHTYRLGGAEIGINVRGDGVYIGVDAAVPCGLIANELITNSLKYAFPAGRPGSIDVELTRDAAGGFTFVVADDGVGMPADVDPQKSPSLGLRLVVALVEQLQGTLKVERGTGTRFEVTVPVGAER